MIVLRRLALVAVLSAGGLVACGGDSKSSVEPQIGSTDLVMSREGDATVLSAQGPVSPAVIIPDDALPSGVTPDDITGTVLYATDPGTGATAVEFQLGPDGTQFEKPVELKWIGQSGDGVSTLIMAVNDKGENLLSQEEAASIVSTLAATGSTSEGRSEVSVKVDHFSHWYIYQRDEAVLIDSIDTNPFFIDIKLGSVYWDPGFATPAGKLYLEASRFGSDTTTNVRPCITPKVTISGGATFYAEEGESCGKREYEERVIKVKCPDATTSGKVMVNFDAYFGVPGFAPMEKLALLLSGDKRSVSNNSKNEDAFVVSTEIAVFVSGRVVRDYNCADGAQSTLPPVTVTTPDSSATTLGDTPSTSVTPTTRVGVTSTSSPTRSNSTSTMAPSGATTTTMYEEPSEPAGTWLRNDSRCRWHGSSTCGVYSSGHSTWVEAGPSGGPGSTYFPTGGTSGELAYNLLSGNSITECDWNGSGGCGFYYTGTPGDFTVGPLG